MVIPAILRHTTLGKVSVVLLPNASLAQESVHLKKYWGQEIVIKMCRCASGLDEV